MCCRTAKRYTVQSEVTNTNDIVCLFTAKHRVYDRFIQMVGYPRGLRSFFEHSPLLRSGLRVLDAGCGTGAVTIALHQALVRRDIAPSAIDAFDLTPAMLNHFHDKLESRGIQQIATTQANVLQLDQLPHGWTDYDLIVSASMLEYGRRFRALTLLDLFTRECLAIDIGQGLGGRDVVATLERLRFERGVPQRIYCDNGTEFVSAAMDLWAYTNGVILDFSRRGKPTDNAAIESFNGRFREECLNVHWFASMEDAQQKIDAFRWDYNEHRPHRSLKGLSPWEFAERMLSTAAGSPS